jgi:hypothetical protein
MEDLFYREVKPSHREARLTSRLRPIATRAAMGRDRRAIIALTSADATG